MTESRRKALVVVTSSYGDSKLTALRAPPQDAVALAEVLGDPAVGGFDVEKLSDPSCQKLREEVEDFFADRSSDHTLLLHFSCHGVKDEAGTLFLATTDTRCDRLRSTAVPAEYVSSLMLASKARRAVVILDCCYAGAFDRGLGLLTRADPDPHVGESFRNLQRISDTSQRGRAVLAACGAVETAIDGHHDEAAEGLQPSFFTRSVVKGLRSGNADLDGNGEVGVSELHQYVCDEVRELTPHQTPRLWVFGAHGRDLPIARAPARRTESTQLPPKVVTRVQSDDPESRYWIIDDLESMAQGDDIGLALTAVTTLDELLRDDSRRVAARAERARRSAGPRVAPRMLDLGAVPLNSLGPVAVITVEGPPVARFRLEVTTDASWLKAEPMPDERGVKVKAAGLPGQGHHQGTVTVRTATGMAAVQVVVEVGTRAGKGRTLVAEIPPSRPMPYWPFSWAAALLAAAFVTLLTSGPDMGFYLWDAFYQGVSGVLVWPGLLLSMVVNTVLAVRAWRGAAVLRRRSVFWSCASLTALNVLGTVMAYSAYFALNYGFEIDYARTAVAVLFLTCACVAELLGCLVLWRAGRAVTPGSAGSPSGR
ncbi:caspase domain-containing protein [Streptomyces sp. NPDC127106]|uniref:caspase family protein n=1 Tax=Streptomyces sp. NPDC127106 TaxID=3345360 RepID=UPI003632F08F